MVLKKATIEEMGINHIELIYDDKIPKDKPGGNIVSFAVYCDSGIVIYIHKEGYDILDLLVLGEAYYGEIFDGERFKVYKCEVVPEV